MEVFNELEGWWNQQDGPSRSPFLRTEWFRLWAACRLGPRERLRVLVGRDGASPVAAVPFLKRSSRLVALSDADSDSFDIVCQDDPRVQAAVVAEVAKRTYVRIDRLNGASRLMENVKTVPGWRARRVINSPYIATAYGPGAVVEGMGKKLRSNVRRAERHLERAGALSVELSTSSMFVKSALEESLALEARGWKGRIGRSVIDSPSKLLFYRRLADVALDRDWLRLGVLRLDGRIVAFNFDIEFRNRMFGLITSYDEELDSKLSPSHVLLQKTLEDCAARGVDSYELGGSDKNSWKMRWTNATRRRYDIIGFGNNLAGRVGSVVSRLRVKAT